MRDRVELYSLLVERVGAGKREQLIGGAAGRGWPLDRVNCSFSAVNRADVAASLGRPGPPMTRRVPRKLHGDYAALGGDESSL